MLILGIDPGPIKSGWALWQPGYKVLNSAQENGGAWDNERFLNVCRYAPSLANIDLVVVERIVIYQASADTIHNTIVHYGRLLEIFDQRDATVMLLKRCEITKALGVKGGKGSKDSKVREKLQEIVGPTGNKRKPGPTYGVTGHSWQALGAAVAGYRLTS